MFTSYQPGGRRRVRDRNDAGGHAPGARDARAETPAAASTASVSSHSSATTAARVVHRTRPSTAKRTSTFLGKAKRDAFGALSLDIDQVNLPSRFLTQRYLLSDHDARMVVSRATPVKDLAGRRISTLPPARRPHGSRRGRDRSPVRLASRRRRPPRAHHRRQADRRPRARSLIELFPQASGDPRECAGLRRFRAPVALPSAIDPGDLRRSFDSFVGEGE